MGRPCLETQRWQVGSTDASLDSARRRTQARETGNKVGRRFRGICPGARTKVGDLGRRQQRMADGRSWICEQSDGAGRRISQIRSRAMFYYGSWTGACGPSWSCRVSHPKDVSFLVLFGALGPGVYRDRLWSRRRGSNIIKIDRWTLPGPSAPSLWPRHIWTHFGSLLGIRFRTHFCSILEAVSGLILELIRDSFWTSFEAPKTSRKVARRRHTES